MSLTRLELRQGPSQRLGDRIALWIAKLRPSVLWKWEHLLAMVHLGGRNLVAMASNLEAMASNIIRNTSRGSGDIFSQHWE